MSKKNILFLPILLLITSITCFGQKAAVGVQLIGVYNMLTKASNAPSKNPPKVLLKSERTPITGDPWSPNAMRLPVEIEIWFDQNLDTQGNVQPYIIRIEEDTANYHSCPGDKVAVKAEVYIKTPGDLKSKSDTSETTCISNAKFGLKKGDLVSQFQNVMLFLADQDSQDTDELPFKFGIAAWTATAGIWHNKFISYSPANKATNAPAVNFPLKETTYLGKKQNLGLFVLQGLPVWGGGQVPRRYHMHILHLMNNTQYPLLVRRTVTGELSKYNFYCTVPPRSAGPFAFIWIPKISESSLENQPTAAIRFYILKKAKRGALPAGFNSVDSVEGEEVGNALNDADIDTKVDQIFENNTPAANEISGFNDRIAELQRDPTTEVWGKGNYAYKICAVPTDIKNLLSQQDIVVIRRNLADSSETVITRLKDPKYKGLRAETDLRLIINEKTPTEGQPTEFVEFYIDNYLDNAVFEGI